MSQVVIYSKEVCPYCVNAKNLLQKKGAQFTEIKISDDVTREEMIKKSGGRMTVPQIFIGEKHIGVYDDLRALDAAGMLDELLK
jgi:glutaredoxin 3